MNKITIPVTIGLVLLIFAGCSTGFSVNPDPVEETSVLAETLPVTTLTPAITPTVNSFTLSPQPYQSPSGAYEINLPQNWNCSESSPYRVDCQSPDGLSAMNIRLIHTGMRLSQPELLNLADAEINFTHAGKRAFNEDDRLIGDGVLTAQSSWMDGESTWIGEDHFVRSESVVYLFSFTSIQDVWSDYEKLVDKIKESTRFDPTAISGDPLYASSFQYTAPDSLFTIDVPTSWTKFLDTASIQKSQVEQFFSPDRRASIQTLVYRHGALIKQEFKATKTLEILRALYGSGFRVSHDKALPDGRERLAWYVESKELSGVSFFDSWGGSLYIFTVLWDDEYQPLYQPVLDRVVESFGFP
ncbi:MAG: hypothetical protein FJZ98_03045 [Chloroflexi bacterium]|nr:hypothetical protein [Chloroflexota bacterium]